MKFYEEKESKELFRMSIIEQQHKKPTISCTEETLFKVNARDRLLLSIPDE
jgi:hypothetical protein